MLPRRERLPRASFPRSGATRRSSAHFTAVFSPAGAGVAVVISKKALKKAVDRHRLKRRILGALQHPPPLSRPRALILYPKAAALELDAHTMRAELATLLSGAIMR